MQTSTPSFAAMRAARVMLCLLAIVVLSQLAACGGGGDDGSEPDKTIDPLVCMHRPQVCK